MAVLAMGMAAYSSDLKKGTMPEKTVVEQETHSEETAETKTNGAEPSKPEPMETQKDGEDSKADEENIEAGPITRIVEKYKGTTITIRDPGNEMFYYFSTEGANIVEGGTHIAVGNKVEISSQGLLSDEMHPDEAVKIVAVTDK